MEKKSEKTAKNRRDYKIRYEQDSSNGIIMVGRKMESRPTR